MGKSKKARAARSLPYARPDAAMEVDDAAAPAPVDKAGKPLSAHMRKVVERKRLQAQIKEVALQRRKIKGGDKKTVKKAKKELSKQIRSSQRERQGLQSFVESQRAREGPAPEPAAPQGAAAPFQFDLPLKPMAVDPSFLASR